MLGALRRRDRGSSPLAADRSPDDAYSPAGHCSAAGTNFWKNCPKGTIYFIVASISISALQLVISGSSGDQSLSPD